MSMRSDLTEAGSEPRKAPLAWALIGAVMALGGAAVFAGVVFIGNSRSSSAEHAMISLGLAGSVLVSAVAQGMVIVGAWMVWRATRRRG